MSCTCLGDYGAVRVDASAASRDADQGFNSKALERDLDINITFALTHHLPQEASAKEAQSGIAAIGLALGPSKPLLTLQKQHSDPSTRTCISTSATLQSNSNDGRSKMAVQQPLTNTPHRRVLGDVSPNIKSASPVPAFLRKPPASSPLKRSYTAAMEGGEGLMYLKKRKLSEEDTLSQIDGVSELVSREDNGQENARFRPIFQPVEVETLDDPFIVQPSPTEPNTPSVHGEPTQDSSADRVSFSSLINYDPSSQPASLAFTSISHAELLKLRLRVAMYKVRTSQIDVPFAELRVPNSVRSTKSYTAQAVEEAVAQLRREAQQINDRQTTAIPMLLPAPVLRPTAYSSRMIYDTHLPSSPPVSVSPEKLPSIPGDVSTPRRELGKHGNFERFVGPVEQELTSSAVKGRVAEGLLGLRNAS